MTRPTFRDRVFSRLIIDPSGCLLWTGARVKGYGVTAENSKKNHYVHRLMYEWFNGPIPAGMEIDHLCRVKHCAAPGDQASVAGRHNAVKTHCPYGHPYDDANTQHYKGGRSCRQCKRDRYAGTGRFAEGKGRADGAGWGGGT